MKIKPFVTIWKDNWALQANSKTLIRGCSGLWLHRCGRGGIGTLSRRLFRDFNLRSLK